MYIVRRSHFLCRNVSLSLSVFRRFSVSARVIYGRLEFCSFVFIRYALSYHLVCRIRGLYQNTEGILTIIEVAVNLEERLSNRLLLTVNV